MSALKLRCAPLDGAGAVQRVDPLGYSSGAMIVTMPPSARQFWTTLRGADGSGESPCSGWLECQDDRSRLSLIGEWAQRAVAESGLTFEVAASRLGRGRAWLNSRVGSDAKFTFSRYELNWFACVTGAPLTGAVLQAFSEYEAIPSNISAEHRAWLARRKLLLCTNAHEEIQAILDLAMYVRGSSNESRDREILVKRFGLGDVPVTPTKKLAEQFGMSPQGVSQIANACLKALRKVTGSQLAIVSAAVEQAAIYVGESIASISANLERLLGPLSLEGAIHFYQVVEGFERGLRVEVESVGGVSVPILAGEPDGNEAWRVTEVYFGRTDAELQREREMRRPSFDELYEISEIGWRHRPRRRTS